MFQFSDFSNLRPKETETATKIFPSKRKFEDLILRISEPIARLIIGKKYPDCYRILYRVDFREAVEEIRKLDDNFSIESFLLQCKNHILPEFFKKENFESTQKKRREISFIKWFKKDTNC